MTAALYAQRNGKQALVIEKNGFGGQITHSPKVENYPGTLSMSGNEFAEHTLDQILAQGAQIEFETVVSVEDAGDCKIVKTEEGGVYEGRTVILATGVKHRMLGLEGEEDLVGKAFPSVPSATGISMQIKPCVLPAAATVRCRKGSFLPKRAAK